MLVKRAEHAMVHRFLFTDLEDIVEYIILKPRNVPFRFTYYC